MCTKPEIQRGNPLTFGNVKRKKRKNFMSNRELYSFIAGMIATFLMIIAMLTLFNALSSRNFSVHTEQDVINIYQMSVRSVFYYHDILDYNDGKTPLENIDWKIVIYDSSLDDNVYGTVFGNSTIFIRSGQMPAQIRRTCGHEILHLLGCGERCAYYLQWQIDIPPCSYLFMNATETYAQSRIDYYWLFG